VITIRELEKDSYPTSRCCDFQWFVQGKNVKTKASTLKAKAKASTLKAKASILKAKAKVSTLKAKASTRKAKAKASTLKAKVKAKAFKHTAISETSIRSTSHSLTG